MEDENIKTLDELDDRKLYRVGVLMNILKEMNLNYSIYSIRDAETWKCLNYKCGKRHNEEVEKCSRCGGSVRQPFIPSPRTRGGGKGPGHRRYDTGEIRKIVEIFKERV